MTIPKLCIGTAQFGLPYGITNSNGVVNETEVERILEYASKRSINLLDTAQAYGSAESVLGRTIHGHHRFHIISKLPSQHQHFYSCKDAQRWEKAFHQTLLDLQQEKLDSFLLHRPTDLAKPGANHLLHWLRSLRDRGLVNRLGVSIYSSDDLYYVPEDVLQVVQLPLSLYDQRLLTDGTIDKLSSLGTAIFARSLFLQGLLLTPSNLWPGWVSTDSRLHHSRLLEYTSNLGSTLLDINLEFARKQSSITAFVLGVCSLEQLISIHRTWDSSHTTCCDFSRWSLDDPILTDPRTWPPNSTSNSSP